jgi:cysteinyl-tRNA synthetase
LIEDVARDGFDGAYLDWVLGYLDPTVVAAAQRDGVEPATAMVDLLMHLRARARALRPDFVLIAQNAAGLLARDARLLAAVDAVSQEDLSFKGLAGAGWDEPGAGDLATPPAHAETIASQLAACRAHALPVFTLDYAREHTNVQRALARSRALGLVPCVSRVALDRLPSEMLVPAAPR